MFTRRGPAILYAPDISETIWNRVFGMGDEEYNVKLTVQRNRAREEHSVDVRYWGIWKQFIAAMKAEDAAAPTEA
ncbi:hypothetical protein SDC9_204626 [bioreactor metagenome]|uniref:Uncharacterized protein n=1 Tax=bioreactor metagenome TaxID=1076179 RepID=A0A645JBL8_9ZZZZ